MPSGIQLHHDNIKPKIQISKLSYDMNFIREILSQKFPQFQDLSTASDICASTIATQDLLDAAEISNHFRSLNDSFFTKVFYLKFL